MSLRKFLRWDEDSRQAAYALYYDDLERCSHCGQLREVCSDAKRQWFPQRSICYATMERDAAARTYQRIHADRPFHNGRFSSWSKHASSSHPYHFMDGVVIYAADVDINPSDDFLAPPPLFVNVEEVTDGDTPREGRS